MEAPEDDWQQVTAFPTECPTCQTPVLIGVLARWAWDAVAGHAHLELRPDSTDMWAHHWVHEQGELHGQP